jgi:hypothetical protein
MLELIAIPYIFLLVCFAVGWGLSYRMLYGPVVGRIFNYSSVDPHQAWSRPRNIADLCRMDKEGTLTDPLVKKWVHIYTNSRRVTIILFVPIILSLFYTISLIILSAP